MSASSSSSATFCQTSPRNHPGYGGSPSRGGPQNLQGIAGLPGAPRGSGPPTGAGRPRGGAHVQARLSSPTSPPARAVCAVRPPRRVPQAGPPRHVEGQTRKDRQAAGRAVPGPAPPGAAHLQEGAPPQLRARDPARPGPVHRVEDPLDDLRGAAVSEPGTETQVAGRGRPLHAQGLARGCVRPPAEGSTREGRGAGGPPLRVQVGLCTRPTHLSCDRAWAAVPKGCSPHSCAGLTPNDNAPRMSTDA